jgi:hypothetical protein
MNGFFICFILNHKTHSIYSKSIKDGRRKNAIMKEEDIIMILYRTVSWEDKE